METSTSLATGTGGEPLRTERLSALPSLPRSGAHETGATFAREVERAVERSRGEGLRAERLEELDDARRATRRAGFGRERALDDEARPTEATFRPEHAPVAVQPAAVAARPAAVAEAEPPFLADPADPAPASAPGSATPSTGADAALASAPGVAATPAARSTPGPSAAQALAEAALPRAAGASESRSLELPALVRPLAPRSAQPAPAAGATAGPDAAVLERSAEILRQVQLHLGPHVRRLTLELEPAELGRLSVQLALRTGKITAIVRAESAETLELLRAREEELQDVFAARGIAADAIRFELGFRAAAQRGSPESRAPSPRPPSHPDTPPRGPSARLDTYA